MAAKATHAVKYRKGKRSLVENPGFRSSKCHGCKKQMITNVDPRYAGELDDPQGGDTTMLMQLVREVKMVNPELEDESSWIWLTSEQMRFPLRSEFAKAWESR